MFDAPLLANPIWGDGLAKRRIVVSNADVVWIRAVLEGYDGLALLFGDGTGDVWLVCPQDRVPELDGLLHDLQAESEAPITICGD